MVTSPSIAQVSRKFIVKITPAGHVTVQKMLAANQDAMNFVYADGHLYYIRSTTTGWNVDMDIVRE